MGNRVVLGGLLVILAACGGHIDAANGEGDSVPLLPRPSRAPSDEVQGIYLPVKAGGAERIAEGVGAPTAIAMTADRVVFTTHDTVVNGDRVEAGALFVADKRSGPALMIAVDRQGASFDALATDGTTAFVATGDARLVGIPIMGGATKAMATLEAAAVALVAFGDYVYFATNTGALARVAKKGGAIEPLATIAGAVRGVDVDDLAVYVATGAGASKPAGIVRVPLDGGAVTVLTSGKEPCAMIRDGRRLFWTSLAPTAPADPAGSATTDNGEVLRLSLDGGEVSTVASGAFAACAIAADTESLYFALSPTTSTGIDAPSVKSSGASPGLGLMKAPIAGGVPVAVAEAANALPRPGAVAVDASHVYWLTRTSVLRLQKRVQERVQEP